MKSTSSRPSGEWNEKYWDMISNLFLTPKYMGWKGISRSEWDIKNGMVSVHETEIEKNANALYSRKPMSKAADIRGLINHQEEILNHIFNVTFAIAGDDIIRKLFCEPLGFQDDGSFISLGREIKKRYELRDNVTQQDGLFVSNKSAIGVELKLESESSAGQIMKYVVLLNAEEKHAQQQLQLGLLFIVPKNAISKHWQSVGLNSPTIDGFYLDRLDEAKKPLNPTMRQLLVENRTALADVLDRIALTVISWDDLYNSVASIQKTLDRANCGDQTAFRLLAGLRAQIETHDGTGVSQSAL
jgi:hypothetical protein